MTQQAGAVIVMESQWRESNPSSFGNIALLRLVLSLAAVMCSHICAHGLHGETACLRRWFISFPGL